MNYQEKTLHDGYSVQIATSFEEIEKMRPIWEEMQWHPNADIDFYLTIGNSRKEILRPNVVLLSSNGCPIAMMVGKVEERRLNFNIGYKTLYKPKVHSLTIVEGGLLGDLCYANADVLLSELIDSMARNEADIVILNSLRVDSDIYALAKKKPHFLCQDKISDHFLHWQMTLPATMDDFFKRLKRARRKELRRYSRVLEKDYPGNVTFRCFQSDDEVDKLCNDAEEIAKRTYHRGLGVGFVYNNENQRRMVLLAKRGWLRAYVLYVGGNPCSFYIGTLYGKTLYLDFTGYDPGYKRYEPGTIAFLKMLEDLCKNSVADYIDFGQGDAFYKRRFGDLSWKEADVMLFSPTFLGVGLNLVRTSTILASRLADKALTLLNLRNKVKKLWRNSRASK